LRLPAEVALGSPLKTITDFAERGSDVIAEGLSTEGAGSRVYLSSGVNVLKLRRRLLLYALGGPEGCAEGALELIIYI
jgi:hypothetical protein